MAAGDPLDRELHALRAIRDDPHLPEAQALLRKVLGGRRSFSVAAAAEIVARGGLRELAPALAAAFDRFIPKGADTDKNCRAKSAIALALQKLECNDADLFLRGIRIVQREPVWGGTVDTAAELRGACALGLAQLDHPEVMNALVELLLDPEWLARAHAARAIGGFGRPEGIPLLRYKVLAGDDSVQVLVECFGALLDLAPRDALAFCARFLHGEDERAEAAALALGQSRRDDALPLLIQWSEALPPPSLRVPLLAIAMLRVPAALDHLLGLVRQAPMEIARQAVTALALHRYDDALRHRVQEAVDQRRSRPLAQVFGEAFTRATPND